jgi:hypothetical protein
MPLFTSLKPGQSFISSPGAKVRTIVAICDGYVRIARHDEESSKSEWLVRVYPDSPLWGKEVEVVKITKIINRPVVGQKELF